MKGISTKLASALGSAAGMAIIAWIASLFGFVIPTEIQVDFIIVIAGIVGYSVPETATNVKNTEIPSTSE